MKRFSVVFFVGLLMVMGCAHAKVTHKTQLVGQEVIKKTEGNKAKVAVADFDVQALKATAEIGEGIRHMIISALQNSGEFVVLEKTGFDVSNGLKDQATEAEIIISATVNEFEPQASGGRSGIGGGGGSSSGALGGLLGGNLNKAHIGLTVRLVRVIDSEILGVMNVQGEASDVSGAVMVGVWGNSALSDKLSAYANTPMEKAIRICVLEAVQYITRKIPNAYFKY